MNEETIQAVDNLLDEIENSDGEKQDEAIKLFDELYGHTGLLEADKTIDAHMTNICHDLEVE